MKLATMNHAQQATQDPCESSVNSLAACYLENSLSQGKSVSIPSLGITIEHPSNSVTTCKNTEK